MNAFLPPSEPEPQPPAPKAPTSFVVCPLHVAVATAWQQEVYRRAFEESLARAQVPHYYRRLFPSWN